MRILSNSAKFQLLVQNEVRQHAQDAQGVLQGYVLKPQIMLQFHQNGITAYEYEFAFRHWGNVSRFDLAGNKANDSWGAHPDTNDGALGGRIYRGWDPRLQFSVIDTEGYHGAEREAIEAYFTANPSGENWIVVVKEAIPAPWPSYDSMQWKRVAPMAHELGLAAEAFRYEASRDKPREAVLKALQEEHAKAVEQAEEDDALTGIIVP